jgi:hypothetical protein
MPCMRRGASALALVEPIQCFAGRSTGYVLRAFPLSVRPRAVIATLPAVSHHQLPFHNASELNRQALSLLG